MSRNRILFYIYILLNLQTFIYGQDESSKIIDSLAQLDFEKLEVTFYEMLDKSLDEAEPYAKAYLQKGIVEKTKFHTARGYYLISQLYRNNLERRIRYVDSAISVSKNLTNEKYPVFFYTHKGYLYSSSGLFNKALDYYLEALEYAKKTNNNGYVCILQHNIGIIKRKYGKYEEAKSLFKKSLIYSKSELNKNKRYKDSITYLNTLSELVSVYIFEKQIDSASHFNKIGLEISKELGVKRFFRLNQGRIDYHNDKYKKAIENLEWVLNPINESNLPGHDLISTYYYLGKSYAALSKNDRAMTYYKKIDSIFQSSHYQIPETRLAYLEIIKHYKSVNDLNNQLSYIDKFLHSDSIYNKNLLDVTNKLNMEYEVPILLEEKEKIIDELKTQNNQSNYGLLILSVVVVIILTVFVVYYQRNKKYKTRFGELMQEQKQLPKEQLIPVVEEIGIADEVVEMILKGLDNFESTNGFLQSNLTSGALASQLNTNSKYLTKVIKFKRDKNFTPYINDLRIEYIVEQLKVDVKLQNYTIKALASEAGFNSTEVFSKSFFKKTGIYPSYFIKKLQNYEKVTDKT